MLEFQKKHYLSFLFVFAAGARLHRVPFNALPKI